MKVRHNSFATEVEFDREDWDNGTARAAIDLIKGLPKGSKMYNPNTKVWRVFKKTMPSGFVKKLIEIKNSIKEEEDVNIDEWKERIFTGTV